MSGRATDSDLARGFLLGTLDSSQRERVAERLFTDEDFYREVLSTEADLMDALVAGELSTEEGTRFRENCIASASQLEKLQFAKALQEAVGPGIRRVRAVAKTRAPTPSRRPAWISAVAAALAALAILLGFFHQRELARRIQDLQSKQAALERQLADRQAVPPAAAAASVTEPAGSPTPARVSLLLASGVLRGESNLPEIRIPTSAETLDLRVEVPSPIEAPSYRLTVADPSGATVFRKADLLVRTIDKTPLVESSIAAQRFQPGVYEVELAAQTPDGRAEPVGYSYFRVVRAD